GIITVPGRLGDSSAVTSVSIVDDPVAVNLPLCIERLVFRTHGISCIALVFLPTPVGGSIPSGKRIALFHKRSLSGNSYFYTHFIVYRIRSTSGRIAIAHVYDSVSWVSGPACIKLYILCSHHEFGTGSIHPALIPLR